MISAAKAINLYVNTNKIFIDDKKTIYQDRSLGNYGAVFMFKFSGLLTRRQWWGRILLLALIGAIPGFITNGLIAVAGQQDSLAAALGLFLPAILIMIFFLIIWMGLTARRLRDAGMTRGNIILFYWLAPLLPGASFVYFCIAAFSPSDPSAAMALNSKTN